MRNDQLKASGFWEAAIQERPELRQWFAHWQGSLGGKSSPLQDELPWMTYAAISWLDQFLRPEMSVFEWGSGGSSAFFAKRVRSVRSVEHDSAWFGSVVDALKTRGYANGEVYLVEPVRGALSTSRYVSSSPDYVGCCFERYASFIDSCPDESFDLVVVDGRARPGCIQHALPKVKRGGFLLLDNSERAAYQAGCSVVDAWPGERMWGPGPYNSYPWETRIWRKEP
jgi:hypothetical protein